MSRTVEQILLTLQKSEQKKEQFLFRMARMFSVKLISIPEKKHYCSLSISQKMLIWFFSTPQKNEKWVALPPMILFYPKNPLRSINIILISRSYTFKIILSSKFFPLIFSHIVIWQNLNILDCFK